MTLDEKYDIAAEIMEMDYTIRHYDGDEEIIMYWLQEGVEDHLDTWTEKDYFDYIDDYNDLVEVFRECMDMMEGDK